MNIYQNIIVCWSFINACDFVVASRSNFQLRRFELCNATQGIIKFIGNITRDGDGYYVTYELTSPIPIGSNMKAVISIQSQIVGSQFLEMFVIRERDTCKAGNMYMGEFLYDIERHSQIPVGVCPLLAGKYHGNHIKIDFNKLSLQTFPFGRLRFMMHTIETSSGKSGLCLLVEVENPQL